MFKTLKDFNVEQKRVLVRCDFNVPLDKNGNIEDDFRIRQAIPTIKHLLEKDAKVILTSHLDDPKGKVVEDLRLTPVQARLTDLLGIPVIKTSDCIGQDIEKLTREIQGGEIVLLENLRFHK